MTRVTQPMLIAILMAGLLVVPGCYEGIADGAATDGDSSQPTQGSDDGPSGGSGSNSDGTDDDDDGGDDGDSGAPSPEGEGPAELPVGRAIRRMTADQYVRSLEVATGQSWAGFEEFSAAMGKADYAEITEHDRTLSVTFEKFINDAALDTCRTAVDLDADEGGDTILRHATIEDTEESSVRANVQYLLLRFLADETELDDEAIDPWASLVMAPIPNPEDATETRRARWTAVCIGLATHVDFITY